MKTARIGQWEQDKQEFGEPLEWERLDGRRACRVAGYRRGTIKDPTASLENITNGPVDDLPSV
jgi:hypothetical protein